MDAHWQPAAVAEDKKPKRRGRAARFLVIVLGAGTLSGIAAMLGIWPFSGFQALATSVVHGNPSNPVQAVTIFPAVPPQHKTVDVYDPPRYPAPTNPKPPAANPPAQQSPDPTPTESPEPGDN